MEAFPLRGLARLAQSWKQDPPFANDSQFGDAIADYRQAVIRDYAKLAGEQGSIRDFAAWFANYRSEIEAAALSPFAQAASLTIRAEYERFPDCVDGTAGPAAAARRLRIIWVCGSKAALNCVPPRICQFGYRNYYEWPDAVLPPDGVD